MGGFVRCIDRQANHAAEECIGANRQKLVAGVKVARTKAARKLAGVLTGLAVSPGGGGDGAGKSNTEVDVFVLVRLIMPVTGNACGTCTAAPERSTFSVDVLTRVVFAFPVSRDCLLDNCVDAAWKVPRRAGTALGRCSRRGPGHHGRISGERSQLWSVGRVKCSL